MEEMIKYPIAYNPILESWEKVQTKEVIVSNKVYRTYRKVVHDIQVQENIFSVAKEQVVCSEFAENYADIPKVNSEGNRCRWNFGKRHPWQRCLDLLILREIENVENRF